MTDPSPPPPSSSYPPLAGECDQSPPDSPPASNPNTSGFKKTVVSGAAKSQSGNSNGNVVAAQAAINAQSNHDHHHEEELSKKASFHDGGFGKPNASLGRSLPNNDEVQRRSAVSGEFKVVLVGSSNAGKTCLAHRYVRKWYSEVGVPTVGAAYNGVYETFTRPIDAGGQGADDTITVKLGLWDTAGQEQFADLVPLYFRDSKAVILVADCTRRDALVDLKRWLVKVSQAAPPDALRYLALSKVDATLDRFVTLDDAVTFAEMASHGLFGSGTATNTVTSSRQSAAGGVSNGGQAPIVNEHSKGRRIDQDNVPQLPPPIRVMELSSKTGEGVAELFRTVAVDCWFAAEQRKNAALLDAQGGAQREDASIRGKGKATKFKRQKCC